MASVLSLAPNQIVVYNNGVETFFSYDTPICSRDIDSIITLHPSWNCSKTTSKYRSIFLGESTAETTARLAAGIHTLKVYNA